MKKIIIITLLVLVFIVSCTPTEPASKGLEQIPEEISEDTAVVEKAAELPEGTCAPHWGCISSSTKAYQEEDCSWVDRKDCPLGCLNGACKAGNTCDPGFKCKDANTKGYQTEVCHWNNEKECQWGCSEGKCNPQPENYTMNQTKEVPEVKEEPTPLVQNYIHLTDKDTHTLELDGAKHNLSILLIEDSRVRLKIDKQKSEWLEDGDNFTHFSGLKIKVQEILFQSYPGGKKAIEYSVE